MLLRDLSAFMSFLLITLFISCLNYSTNSLFSYPLSLAVLLNSCINYSIVLLSCFAFFNLATFIVLSSSLLNSFSNPLEISPSSYIPIFLLPDPLSYSSFRYLLILSTYRIELTTFVLLPLSHLSSF